MNDDPSGGDPHATHSPDSSPIGAMGSNKHSFIGRVVGLLLTGLAAVVPVVGTIWLLVLIYKVLLQVGDLMIRFLLKTLNFMSPGKDLTSECFAFYGSNFVRF